MTVDLSKLKPGDTVKFRCGGEQKVSHNNGFVSVPGLVFEGSSTVFSYFQDGAYGNDGVETPFDIIEIIPAPEKKTPLEKLMETYDGTGYPLDAMVLCRAINETLKQMREEK